jgi:hypothetical protein
MRRKLLLTLAAVVVLAIGAAVLSVVVFLNPANLEARAESELSTRMGLETTIGALEIAWLPWPRLRGAGVALRIPNRDDLPPFIQIESFTVDASPISAYRGRIDAVEIEGLTINVPPGEARDGLPDTAPGDGGEPSPVVIGRLVSRNAVLNFIRGDPERQPLTFAIHDLEIDDLGFTRVMPFRARLTNPVPKGLVETDGSVGPWRPGDPTALPIQGLYTLTDADLSTINGIGGTLQSRGQYVGRLTEITATGTTTTPDFNLDLGGRPMPLETSFTAIVNGTNGSTRLEQVDAKLGDTTIAATGAILNLEGPGRRHVEISSRVTDGRIEDMLALTIDSPKPLLTGDLTSESTLVLPPGPTPVRERLTLSGRFGVGNASFTDAQVNEKLTEFSRRSQGKDAEDMRGRVLTNLSGRFALESGIFSLRSLRFRVPGADVALAGTYDVKSEALDLAGTLRMDATVSEAVGGFKSIFIRPFDGLFRKDGAGAVVPIRIGGTWREPKTNVDFGRIMK